MKSKRAGMDTLYRIERIVRRGVYSLCDSLYQEWPLPDGDLRNEISEANITIHLSHAFLSAEFCAFSEFRIGNSEHHDLVVFHPEMDEYVVVECKRYLATDAQGLSHDISRLNQWWSNKQKPSIAVVIAMTRVQDVRNWWIDPDRGDVPEGKRSLEWRELSRLLAGKDRVVGHVPLAHHGDIDPRFSSGFFHEALYQIYRPCA